MSEWSIKNLMTSVESFLKDVGLPVMEVPATLHSTYSMDDIASLRSDELGELSLRISSWLAYGLRVQGREESELDNFEEVYNIKLWDAVAEKRREVNNVKTPLVLTKEELRSKVIEEDEDLARTTRALMDRRTRVSLLKTQNNIYAEQIQRLSREQSRRESEARLM